MRSAEIAAGNSNVPGELGKLHAIVCRYLIEIHFGCRDIHAFHLPTEGSSPAVRTTGSSRSTNTLFPSDKVIAFRRRWRLSCCSSAVLWGGDNCAIALICGPGRTAVARNIRRSPIRLPIEFRAFASLPRSPRPDKVLRMARKQKIGLFHYIGQASGQHGDCIFDLVGQ